MSRIFIFSHWIEIFKYTIYNTQNKIKIHLQQIMIVALYVCKVCFLELYTVQFITVLYKKITIIERLEMKSSFKRCIINLLKWRSANYNKTKLSFVVNGDSQFWQYILSFWFNVHTVKRTVLNLDRNVTEKGFQTIRYLNLKIKIL